MNISLQDKRALVTGGNSGIGAAIALGLADAGAKVAINYLAHPEAADGLVQAIKQKHGEAISIQANVSDPKAVEDLFRQIDVAWSGIFPSKSSRLGGSLQTERLIGVLIAPGPTASTRTP